jgi:hypothetical protein
MFPLTKDGATLYDDGGFVLAQHADHMRGHEHLELRSGGKVVPGETIQVAPNLFVMRPKGVSSVEIVQGQRKVSATVQHGKVTPLVAPKGVVVASRKAGPVKASYRHVESSSVQIRLAASAPSDALALVVLAAGSRTGIAWMMATPGTTTYGYASSVGGKGCGEPGFGLTSIGDRVQLAWLDAGGRLSPASATITVGAL